MTPLNLSLLTAIKLEQNNFEFKLISSKNVSDMKIIIFCRYLGCQTLTYKLSPIPWFQNRPALLLQNSSFALLNMVSTPSDLVKLLKKTKTKRRQSWLSTYSFSLLFLYCHDFFGRVLEILIAFPSVLNWEFIFAFTDSRPWWENPVYSQIHFFIIRSSIMEPNLVDRKKWKKKVKTKT